MRSFRELINSIYERDKISLQECQNLSLAMTKLVKRDIIENTKKKRYFLQGFTGVLSVKSDFLHRAEKQVEALKSQGYINLSEESNCNCLKLKTSSRLVVGLGSQHVLETALTLHHIWGVPYIPATALKGVVRMVSFWEIWQRNKHADPKSFQEQLYDTPLSSADNEEMITHKLLFGTQGFKGLLLFLDAFPVLNNNSQIFELDIMNVHYKSYYGSEGKVPPGDWENPNPVVFLTVKPGIEFCFCVLFDEYRARLLLKDENIPKGAKSVINGWMNDNNELKVKVKNWLETALKEFGVGAKTRLGYGLFEEIRGQNYGKGELHRVFYKAHR